MLQVRGASTPKKTATACGAGLAHHDAPLLSPVPLDTSPFSFHDAASGSLLPLLSPTESSDGRSCDSSPTSSVLMRPLLSSPPRCAIASTREQSRVLVSMSSSEGYLRHDGILCARTPLTDAKNGDGKPPSEKKLDTLLSGCNSAGRGNSHLGMKVDNPTSRDGDNLRDSNRLKLLPALPVEPCSERNLDSSFREDVGSDNSSAALGSSNQPGHGLSGGLSERSPAKCNESEVPIHATQSFPKPKNKDVPRLKGPLLSSALRVTLGTPIGHRGVSSISRSVQAKLSQARSIHTPAGPSENTDNTHDCASANHCSGGKSRRMPAAPGTGVMPASDGKNARSTVRCVLPGMFDAVSPTVTVGRSQGTPYSVCRVDQDGKRAAGDTNLAQQALDRARGRRSRAEDDTEVENKNSIKGSEALCKTPLKQRNAINENSGTGGECGSCGKDARWPKLCATPQGRLIGTPCSGSKFRSCKAEDESDYDDYDEVKSYTGISFNRVSFHEAKEKISGGDQNTPFLSSSPLSFIKISLGGNRCRTAFTAWDTNVMCQDHGNACFRGGNSKYRAQIQAIFRASPLPFLSIFPTAFATATAAPP